MEATNDTVDAGSDAKNNFAADIESLKSSFTQLRGDLTSLVGSALGAGKSGAFVAKDVAKDHAVAAVEGIKHKIGDLKEKGVHTAQDFETTLGEHPLTTALIAFGAGFIIARLLSRK
ncbi:MAG: hypothetical protein ABSH22_19605 [Tepidisphaeraceae bacterium]|jgi:ElaB/YqjD/DUF883 family membrane-anchored ribosome-binding protein